ncbi:phenazine biosynthesis-like domain-containing protein [Paramacrobiotus metropolitanus]|uniref:phenazine biosynthesis-like domain-containing protein n=1 Tax=Paramacrobiotus metropolitanus TaxID=2943436 RepID=UPI002445D708|nr:phenazine biosynthesis-like domain-containing protein [Paramacrobiotus metropolitanus]
MATPGTEYPLHIVDAFTKVPFEGNPAAVCLLQNDTDIKDETKSKIASEMNLSETAFVSCATPDTNFSRADKFILRWFTPTVEVDLCGHATLATAWVIFHTTNNQHRELKFETRSGTLSAMRKGDSVSLDFPRFPPRPLNADERRLLQPVIDICCGSVGDDSVLEVSLSPDTYKLLIRLKDDVNVSQLKECIVFPDHLLAQDTGGLIKGVILTLKGSAENGAVDREGTPYDFVSRYFAPWQGIAEDPVTGSSHTVLAPYWSEVLHKNMLYARQCSKRGGDLLLTLHPNNRIEIAGHARIVMSGKLML